MTLSDRTWTRTELDYSDAASGGEMAQGRHWQPQQYGHDGQTNVSSSERAVSVAAGSILALLGVVRRDLTGLLIAGVGGALIYRGGTGRCPLYSALDIDTAADEAQERPAKLAENGIHVSESFLFDRPAEELYDYWRKLENLPRIMSHLESVSVLDERRSHWVAKAPAIAGGKVEWDAEITDEQPNQLIAWRSLPGADVDNAGSVRFTPALGDRGTNVRVELSYLPPAGRLGKWVAKLFGEAPDQQIREDLRTFKRVIETGEAPTVVGQPHGTCTGRGVRSPG